MCIYIYIYTYVYIYIYIYIHMYIYIYIYTGKAGTFLIAARPSGFSDAWRSKLGATLGGPAVCMKVGGNI